MQGTMATAGVAAAIVIWATLFRGPEPAVGPGPNVVAQEKAEAEAPATPNANADAASATAVTEGDIEWIDPGRFLPQNLAKPIDVQFTGTPLREVIDYIAEIADLDILLDVPTLSQEGITGDEEVTIDMQQTPVHAVLDVILRNVNNVELAWIQEAEVLRITTKDRADDSLTTQFYNVRDLLNAGYTQNALLRVIHEMTEGPWEEFDGVGGTISEFGDLLIANQIDRTHVDIACTLAALRSTHREARVGELEQHARLYKTLDQRTEMQFTGTPLREVVNYIEEIHDVPVMLDVPVLSVEGITGDEEISIDVSGIKLRSAFELLLGSVNNIELDIIIRDGALGVTTRDEAANHQQTVIYDVSDITSNDETRMEKLIEVIKGQTDGPWEDIQGIGGVLDSPTPGRLACRQSRRAQNEVRAVLAAVRASLEAPAGDRSALTAASTRLETRFYRMDAEAADDVARLIPHLIEPGTWNLYPDGSGTEPDPAQVGTIHQLAAGRMLLRLDNGTIADSNDAPVQQGGSVPGQPQAGEPRPDSSVAGAQSNVVVIPQSVLIITHKPVVLREISKLLESLLSGHGWASHGFRDEKVKFITPGYQEGTWNGALGGAGGPLPSSGGGFFSLTPAVSPGS